MGWEEVWLRPVLPDLDYANVGSLHILILYVCASFRHRLFLFCGKWLCRRFGFSGLKNKRLEKTYDLHYTNACRKQGIITKEMELVAEKEGISPEELRQYMAEGKAVIPANKLHNV